jgi:predicted phosphodiesterase
VLHFRLETALATCPKPMKIVAISDIHGNLNALQAVLAEIDREGVDTIINCGDTLGGPLESAKTADLLTARGIPMIAGNHERQLLTLSPEKLNRSDACTASEINAAHRAWLASAPPTMWLAEDVFICHGIPTSDLHYWLETITDDFGQYGSVGVRPASHAEVLQRLVQVNSPDGGHAITIVNAGSVGLPGYDDVYPHKHWIETGSQHARYALMEKTAQGWNVQLRSVAYDFEPMAQLAERRNRPDWALPLRTGRMSEHY